MPANEPRWRRYLRFFGSDPEADADDELRFHLQEMERGYLAHGMSPAAARRAARAKFGDVERVRREMRRGTRRLHQRTARIERVRALGLDMRLAIRKLSSQPGFTIAAVATLALGIGANTSVFSVVSAALLRPLPFGDPGRIVKLYTSVNGQKWVASPPDFRDWESRTRAFSAMGAMYQDQPTLTGTGDPVPLNGAYVSTGFFDAMGVHPALGHPFTKEETTYGQTDVVILGNGIWKRLFGSDPGILGRTVRLDGKTRRVAGVMPPGFDFPGHSELWMPMAFSDSEMLTQRGAHYLDVVARLRPGVTLSAATRDLDAVAHQLATEYPRTNRGHDAEAVSLRDALVRGDSQRALWIMLGAVGLVALIACVNVANLLLARGAARAREFAVRTALGARSRDLAAMVMVESALLGTMGGVGGLALGAGGIRALNAIRPATLALLPPATVDARVFGFTALLSLGTIILFGLAPALQAMRVSRMRRAMQDGARGGTTGLRGWRARWLLVAGELALAMILLTGAGLLIRSFSALQHVPSGFDASGVLTVGVSLPDARYPAASQSEAFYRRALQQIRGLPGVVQAGAITGVPLSGFNFQISTRAIDGRLIPDAEQPSLQIRVITPGYFGTLHIPVKRGRMFTPQDRAGAPPVVMVNESAARLLWKDESPLGHTVEIGTTFGLGRGRAGGEVVGVVHDVHDELLSTRPRPILYLAHEQYPIPYMTLVIRGVAGTDPVRLVAGVRRTVHDLDPDLPLLNVATMQRIAAGSVADPRFAMAVLATFAGLALVLAAIGVFGVMAYVVGQRTREIGVRMALGASAHAIVAETIRIAAGPIALGLAVGILGALALTQLMTHLLFAVKSADALTFTVMGLCLASIAGLSAWLPARRASRVDPVIALKSD
ncbi:MAG TPA: ABC transporter permease [Gemmatimonadales bacterium]|nr:ABC transporter permease [Gemmatimonadales bacterium]